MRKWPKWSAHAFPDFGRFGNALRDQNQLVTAQFQEKDVAFVALALSRFSRARVVPEEGISRTVNLTLSQATLPEAVGQLARQVRRRWTVFYLLAPGLLGDGARLPDNRDATAVTMSLGLLPGGHPTNISPQDKLGYFQKEGSSYEWAYLLNGKILHQIEVGPAWARFNLPLDQAPLMFDYENFHPTKAGSALLGGAEAGFVPSLDFQGTRRVAPFDVGACEVESQPWRPGCTHEAAAGADVFSPVRP